MSSSAPQSRSLSSSIHSRDSAAQTQSARVRTPTPISFGYFPHSTYRVDIQNLAHHMHGLVLDDGPIQLDTGADEIRVTIPNPLSFSDLYSHRTTVAVCLANGQLISIPFSVRHFRRDPYLTWDEVLDYLSSYDSPPLPTQPLNLDHIPKRYASREDQHRFHGFTNGFFVEDGLLYHRFTGLPVCVQDAFKTYTDIVLKWKKSPAMVEKWKYGAKVFNKMVEEESGLWFIDGDVFAEHFVHDVPLPSRPEFGLLSGDLFEN
ncbi:hypothetical protein V5O48_016807 [Marasmius crinis-equi]|uniref:Uncharacterized protein n=1 Tax=Marasmius crinis-equi TaxID=585013 RepID=A0ABR3EQT8_9AGAR